MAGDFLSLVLFYVVSKHASILCKYKCETEQEGEQKQKILSLTYYTNGK